MNSAPNDEVRPNLICNMSKATTPQEGNKIAGVYCQIFGHHYVVSKKITEHIKEYTCVHCQKQVTTDASGRLTALTERMREINAALHDMYQRRNRLGRPKKAPVRKVA